MGEYRVKSSRGAALADRLNSTELPQLNVLNNRKSDAQASSVQSGAEKFSLADDEPTEVGSADALLAAVGGLDGWDCITDSSSSVGMSETDLMSTLDNFSSELFNDIDKMDTDKTQALQAPDFNNLPNIKSSGDLPMPKAGGASKARSNRQAILDEDIDIPSLRNSKTQGSEDIKKPTISKPTISKPSVSTPSSTGIKPISSVIPAVNASPSLVSQADESVLVSEDQAAAELSSSSASAVPEVNAEPEVKAASEAIPEVKAAPEPVSEVKATPEPVPEVKAAPKSAQVKAAPAPERELSEEEQFAAALEAMSPAERAEYAAHCHAQEREEIEENRRRQQRLMENYGMSSSVTTRSKAPVGLFIVILVLVGAIGAGLYFLLNSEPEPAAEPEAASAEAEKAPEPVRAAPLETYTVNIEAKDVDKLYINGVLKSGSGAYEFVKGHRNSVLAFTSGMVPYFRTFGVDETVTETIKIELEPDTLYAKGRLSFRLTDPGIAGAGLKVELDGVPLSNFPDAQPSVVLGRPHMLTLEKEGYGKHMHLIWPDDATNTVTIPELASADTAKLGTNCSIKKFPSSTKPYGLLIEFDGQKVSTPIIATVPVGGMVEYHITREQRKPLQVALIPEGYGTVSLDTSLMHDSIGKSVVSFKNISKRDDLQVCMRRSGEVICPSMSEATEVPSGTEWEMFGVGGTAENPQPFKGAQSQELQSSRKYSFSANLNPRGTFELKQTSYDRIKKAEK